jgi:hypothetical protein
MLNEAGPLSRIRTTIQLSGFCTTTGIERGGSRPGEIPQPLGLASPPGRREAWHKAMDPGKARGKAPELANRAGDEERRK